MSRLNFIWQSLLQRYAELESTLFRTKMLLLIYHTEASTDNRGSECYEDSLYFKRITIYWFSNLRQCVLMLVDKTTFFSQSFHVKKGVYEGIAFCSFQPAQLALWLRMKGELRFQLKMAMSLRCFTIVVFNSFSRLFSIVYPMVSQTFAFQLCRVW